MKVLILDAPQHMLDERRRLGLDGRDEMWDGVLHMVPPAGDRHQGLGAAFLVAVAPLAESRGLVSRYETGLFHADDDYRVPDLLFRRPDQGSERGAEGAELVVEIRSPNDETYVKLPFYAQIGVREVLVLHPEDRRVELFRPVAGQMLPVTADASGGLRCEVLGIWLLTVDQKLRIAWDSGSAEV
jgi:Uma2 family endonuclease